MEHAITATETGIVVGVECRAGGQWSERAKPLVTLDLMDPDEAGAGTDRCPARTLRRCALTWWPCWSAVPHRWIRPARRQWLAGTRLRDGTGMENVADLCDAGTFVEYGGPGGRRPARQAIDGRADRQGAHGTGSSPARDR